MKLPKWLLALNESSKKAMILLLKVVIALAILSAIVFVAIKKPMLIVGFFVAILGLAAIVALVAVVVKKMFSENPSRNPKPGEDKPKAKKWNFSTVGAIVVIVLIAAVIWGYSFVSNYLYPTASSPSTQNWQLCWEKKPEHVGKTGTRNHCVSGKIEKKNNAHLVFAYNGNFGQGVLEGTSVDGISYSGEWEDSTGWGKTHIRFSSSDTAFGWWDDEGKGEKIPTVLEKI